MLLKGLADKGRTVLLSSHLMSEMALTAEHLIVIGRGKLIRDMSVADFIASASDSAVLVRTPDEQGLRDCRPRRRRERDHARCRSTGGHAA